MAQYPGAKGVGSTAQEWLARQETDRSHCILAREGWSDVVFAFHDREEIGPRMLARIAKRTGLRPEDL